MGLGAAAVVSRAVGLTESVERGAIDLVLSRPIPRWTVVISQLMALLIGAAALMAAAWLGVCLGALAIGAAASLPLLRYALIATVAWALLGALGAGALVISSASRSASTAAGVGTAWTLLSFMLDVLPVGQSPLGQLNPWHHYDPPQLLATGQLPATSALVLAGWIVGGALAACGLFARRDLP